MVSNILLLVSKIGINRVQRVSARPRYRRPILKLIMFNSDGRFSAELLSSVFNHKD